MNERKENPIVKRNAIEQEIVISKILNLMAERIGDDDRYAYRNHYKMSEDAEKITGNRHNHITGKALRIVRYVLKNGGDDGDIFGSLMYLSICIDAKKYNLDWKRAYREMKINDLLEKYGGKRLEKKSEE